MNKHLLGLSRLDVSNYKPSICRVNHVKSEHQKQPSRGVFLGKGVLKIWSKFTGEHPCQRVISIKLLCNFIEITLRHAFSPANLLRIFRTLFPKNAPGGLILSVKFIYPISHQCSISIPLCQLSKLEVFLRFQGMLDGTIS